VTVIATGLDYSARRLPGASIRAAGHRFVIRYLWFPGQRLSYIDALEYADLVAAGVDVHLVYEQTTSDPAGGWAAGVRMGRQAVQSAREVGAPAGTTIFFCADGWLNANGIPVTTAMAFLDGARSVIGEYTLGAYGFADFVFAAAGGGHADRFWLCGAEIPEAQRPDWLHLYQWNNGRAYVDGVECDLNKQYQPLSAGPGSGGGGGEGGGFLMGLEQWQQERMFDRILAMSAGVDGQNFNGSQFEHEETWRNVATAKLDAISATLAQVAEHDDRITLDPAQLAALTTSVGDQVSAEVDETEAVLVRRLDAMAEQLGATLGVGRDVVLAALKEFYRPAVESLEG